MTCGACGAASSPTDRFCAQCGRELEAVTIAPVEQATYAGPLPSRNIAARSTHAADPTPRSDKHSSSGGWLTSSDSISHGRFAPGAILDGRYRIIGLLGRGGMGEVYRADDLRLGQPVALKFLPDAVASDPVRLAQFHNEVRTARQVSHPNICRVYDIGEIDGHLFLSMEFVAGEDLATSLRRIGRFPEDKALDLARQLCAGLAAAHERGVIHRDLKPANVMLDDHGKVRIMDFGLAAAGTVEDIRVGTPAYMAPEQLLGQDVTARSDIYALGLVLYELFSGRRAMTGTTLNDLVEQHQSGEITPLSTIVSTLDPAIERAIARCLERDPAKRPASALAVAAALPGGDPLAAALAAGETPSPEMVAAAGEGVGLSPLSAWAAFAFVVAGIAITYALGTGRSPMDRLQLDYSAEVLAQRARDTVRQLGYEERPDDEAFGFNWSRDVINYHRQKGTLPASDAPLDPSPLTFWYRRAPFALIGTEFHDDLLTPGVVSPQIPAPIWAGEIQLRFDHRGRLQFFQAMPPQRLDEAAGSGTGTVDWTPLFTLAGLDARALRPTQPRWTWLATSDVRAAWIGTGPGGDEPLHVEAAALNGRPLAFLVVGPWTQPWRESEEGSSAGELATVAIYFSLGFVVLVAGAVLARRNLRAGRGDREGAVTLGVAIGCALWALWICDVHVTASPGLVGPFFLAVVTTVFYAVLFWAVYLAIEPFVRRYWPQTLVSWTAILRGRLGDPIVGRDVLLGTALGLAVVLLIVVTAARGMGEWGWPGVDFLSGARAASGQILHTAINSVRTGLLLFFMLFVLRVLLRHQWLAAFAFAALFGLQSALDARQPILDFSIAFVYFGLFAFAAVRWGFTTLVVSVTVTNWLLNMPVTSNVSSWWISQAIVLIALCVALAGWGLYRSLGGRLWRADLLP